MRERNRQAVTPSTLKKEDVSDELTALFDDGTKLASTPAQDTLGTQSTKSIPISQSPALPVAPARDYMKVANSISRQAVPAGLFKGKAKQIYDFLYSKTRGAIVPARSVRLTRREIMDGSHIGSTKTLYLNLLHLRAVGLVECQEIVGPHGGNEYTVQLPEETAARGTQSTMSTQSTSSNSSPNVLRVLGVESTLSTHSSSVDKTDSSSIPKTFIKDKDRSDDEPLADLLAKFQQATRNLTGRELSSTERAKWGELADLLVAELQIAAARTGSVSSVPAFLTEHLRRRLWKKDKAQLERESREVANEQVSQIDASKCPDCGGSGWWYPEGPERGVTKCKHARLVGINEEGQ